MTGTEGASVRKKGRIMIWGMCAFRMLRTDEDFDEVFAGGVVQGVRGEGFG